MKKNLGIFVLLVVFLAVAFMLSGCGECEHNYISETTKEASCVENGELTYTCSLCGSSYVETLYALGHDEQEHSAKAPTCLDEGWESYVSCSHCDYTTVSLIPAAQDAHVVKDGACTFCNIPESTEGLEYSLNSDGKSYTVTGIGECEQTDIVIGIYDNKSVTKIADRAFCNNTSITSVSIPGSITIIGNYAFGGCSYLESVTLGDGLKIIRDNAFKNCYYLTSVIIPDGVESIGYNVFEECISLKRLVIPESVSTVGQYVFKGCEDLTLFCEAKELPVGWMAFVGLNAGTPDVVWGCVMSDSVYDYVVVDGKAKLVRYKGTDTEITVPNFIGGYEVSDIEWAFFDNKDMISVVIAEGVGSIGYRTFYGCTKLEGITLPNSLTSIGKEAFFACASLDGITIPDSVTSIGNAAFSSCVTLRSVKLPGGITSISHSLFSGCLSLTSIVVPEGITSIGNDAFSGCIFLEEISLPSSLKDIGYYSFYYCASLTEIALPIGLEKIQMYAFGYCISVKEIVIPVSVVSIGNRAFEECTGLTIYCEAGANQLGGGSGWSYGVASVVFGHNNVTTNSEYDYAVHDGKAYLTKYKGNYEDVVVPAVIDGYEVASLGAIFYYDLSLTSVTISQGITNIGNAFHYCRNLESIYIPESVTYIGSDAFRECNKLTVYCEAEEQPAGWVEDWNENYCPVVWGYTYTSEP